MYQDRQNSSYSQQENGSVSRVFFFKWAGKGEPRVAEGGWVGVGDVSQGQIKASGSSMSSNNVNMLHKHALDVAACSNVGVTLKGKGS